jgi:hypothetical protein
VKDDTGFVVAANNPQQVLNDIASILNNLAVHQDSLCELSQNAKKYANLQLNWDAKGRRMAETYERVLAGKALTA